MLIKIGDVFSFDKPSAWQVQPDDRQVLNKTIGGVYVTDNGIIAGGEIISCTALFTAEAYVVIRGYWTARTLVTLINEKGESLANRRVLIRREERNPRFPNKYILTLEFWAV